MSCFVCSDKHFQVIAKTLVSTKCYINGLGELTSNNIQSWIDVVHAQNLRSYEYRYKERCDDAAPQYDSKVAQVSVIEAYKLLDSLEYQSCETENYRDTVAYKYLMLAKDSLINKHPDYEKAQWSI